MDLKKLSWILWILTVRKSFLFCGLSLRTYLKIELGSNKAITRRVFWKFNLYMFVGSCERYW